MIRWVAGLVLLAGPSHAMIQCIYYDEMVAEATLVVQIEGAKISDPDAGGNCVVSGPVVQIFSGAMALGDWIETAVPCHFDEPIAGPTIWTSPEALKAARVIELHLNDGQGMTGYGAGIALLDAVTPEPAWKPMCGGE
jgi:hypothetical protein